MVGLESDSDVALALAALERLGIAHLADRGIDTLSGGERQLVMFARALVQDPDVLLLDEPTAFLDLKHRVDVLQEIRAFARSGRAALIVSHDLSLAARSCDRIVLLEPGAEVGGVAAVGPPSEILTAENLRRAFGIETLTFPGPDGALVVVPSLPEIDGP
jgi:iron complex transport system ATP-binding protein